MDNAEDVQLLLQYMGVGLLALISYGALAALLGAYTKRPIVYGANPLKADGLGRQVVDDDRSRVGADSVGDGLPVYQ